MRPERPNPAGVRFVMEPTAGPPFELWLVCRAAGDDPVPVQLAIDSSDGRDDAAPGEQIDQVVAVLQRLAGAHGLEVLEDPRPQLEAHGHQRSADPVVQRAVAAAHADGWGTYRQLADQFGLASADETRDAIRAGAVLLAEDPPDQPARAPTGRASGPPGPNEPDEVQRRKFDEFQVHPVRDAALELLRRYVALAGLELSELNVTWGVTVCVENQAVLRVNVGPRVAFDIVSNGNVTKIYAVGDPPDISRQPDARIARAFPVVPGSFSLQFPSQDPSAMDLPGLRSGVRDYVESQRRGIRSRFHNPLMTPVVEALLR